MFDSVMCMVQIPYVLPLSFPFPEQLQLSSYRITCTAAPWLTLSSIMPRLCVFCGMTAGKYGPRANAEQREHACLYRALSGINRMSSAEHVCSCHQGTAKQPLLPSAEEITSIPLEQFHSSLRMAITALYADEQDATATETAIMVSAHSFNSDVH